MARIQVARGFRPINTLRGFAENYPQRQRFRAAQWKFNLEKKYQRDMALCSQADDDNVKLFTG